VTLVLGSATSFVLHHQRGREESEDDQDGHHGVEHFSGQVILGLSRDVVTLAPETDDRVDEEHDHESTDDDGSDGESLPEVVHRTRLRGRALMGAEEGTVHPERASAARGVQRIAAPDATDECEQLHPVGQGR